MKFRQAISAGLLLLAATAVAQNCPALQTNKASLKMVADRQVRDPSYIGSVTLKVVVSETGKVLEVHADASTSKDLYKRAVQEVKFWKFEPAKKDGKPVKVQVKVVADFTRTADCQITVKKSPLPAEQ